MYIILLSRALQDETSNIQLGVEISLLVRDISYA